MITRGRSTLAVLLTPLLASCAGGAGGSAQAFDGSYSVSYRTDIQGVRYSFASSADQVVETLPRVYQQLGFPGSLAATQDEIVFVSPSARAEGRIYEGERNSEYMDCGMGTTGPRADTYLLEFVLVTRVVPLEGGGSEIEIIVDGHGSDRYSSSNRVPCRGTGKFEGQIADLLRRMLTR